MQGLRETIERVSSEIDNYTAGTLKACAKSLPRPMLLEIIEEILTTEEKERWDSILEVEFSKQTERWRRETIHTSSVTKMVTHPSYLRIIGMGPAALPLIFAELERSPDHWLVALNAITGQDPAKPNSTFPEAVEAWLTWGRAEGYLK